MTEISYTQKLSALRRELAMRERVYPARVADRRMTQAEADHQIAVMAAIVRDYDYWGQGETGGVARGRELAGAAPARQLNLDTTSR